MYAFRVAVPVVLSISELREHLADAMTRVRTSADAAVFVGRHRRAEAVLLSADRYAQLVAEERHAAVADAVGSVRAEGLELGPLGEAVLGEVAGGTLTTQEARARLLAHYRRGGDPGRS
jgi:PHD/YefM family antitoxin component YafN of YafNO toxin-antitoxin module